MKKIFLFLVVVIGLSACANDKTSSTNTATKRENISNKNIELVNQYFEYLNKHCLLYTSPSPRDQRGSRMPSSA